MKLTKVLGTLALLAVGGASAAHANIRDFSLRCSPGSIRTCASLQVVTTGTWYGGTSVIIRVRNLAGSLATDNTGGSLITRIGIVAPHIVLNGNTLGVTTSGGGTQVGSAAANWFLRSPGGLGNPIELTAGITPGTLSGGIAGCSTPLHGYPTSYFTTCSATSWVEFSFQTSNAWDADNSEVAWLVQDITNAPSSTVECGSNFSGPNGAPREWCVGVVPEPVTMVLLGSGLAGMSGFGFVRRRMKKDVDA